ncbi:MAG: ATP-binding protein [Pseudomonadota bacterium]
MSQRRKLIVFALLAAGGIAAFIQAYSWANGFYLKRAQSSGQLTLALVSEAIDQTIGRYQPIPGLIAGDPALQQMLKGNTGTGSPFINEKLRQMALSIEASEVYVMDPSGLTIAASNYRDDDSFLGRNFAFRPYFIEALAGKSSFFHALGTTSGERGFFFSAPVLDGIEVLGVLAVKITVGEIEQDWIGIGHDILIADGNGIVFLASRESFKFGALVPLATPVRAQIAQTQQFPLEQVQRLDLSADVIGPDVVQVSIPQNARDERYLVASMPLGLAAWHAIVLTPMRPAQIQVFRTMGMGLLALIALFLAGLVIAQRRANILQRIRIETEQRAILEDKVRERTADLDEANANLRAEVAERRHAEERLRKSQKDLVQAGKLAALGQMSAAISHEINQPLAAIKSYADNAVQFLARSRIEEASTNIESISKMSDRMAEISRHLRTFARQPGDALAPVNVSEVIEETIGLVGPQVRASHAEIRFAQPDANIWALGGKLRLQQVLVNIVNNGLEAMRDMPEPLIDIEVKQLQDKVQISLRDNGTGLPEEGMEKVFDAFYTTKEAGEGMGLGMSISQNIISDFGGSLTAANAADGGAIFTVTLQAQAAAAQ